MKNDAYTIIGVIWLAIWITRLISMIVNGSWYYLTHDGIWEFALILIMVILGILALCYPYLRNNRDSFLYKVNKKNRCPDCFGKLNGTDFCPKCGRDLRQISKTRTCWNCGYVEENPSVNSCPKCGREFKKE